MRSAAAGLRREGAGERRMRVSEFLWWGAYSKLMIPYLYGWTADVQLLFLRWEAKTRKIYENKNKTTGQRDYGATGRRDCGTTGRRDCGTTGLEKRKPRGEREWTGRGCDRGEVERPPRPGPVLHKWRRGRVM